MGTVLTGRGDQPDPEPLVAALRATGLDVGAPSVTTRAVLDTFDGLVHRAGLRLEHRDGVLELSGGGAVGAQLPVTGAPRVATDLPPGPFRARLGEIIEIRAVLPRLCLTSRDRRAVRRNRDGKVVAAATLHQRVVTEHGPLEGWFVEVEELTGYEKQAAELVEVVRGVGVRELDGDLVVTAMAAAGVDPAGFDNDPSTPLDPDIDALEGFRLVLANLDRSIDANLQGTIDDVDPEFLHEFRVAIRRSRSVLRHGRAILPADVLTWAADGLRELGMLTGSPRDLDVYVLEWDDYVVDLEPGTVAALQPVRAQLDADRAAAHEELATALRSERVVALLRRWSDWLDTRHDPADGGPHADRPVSDVVRRRIEKAQTRLIEHGRAITPATPAEDVHELRKDAKKLRYLLECFGDLLPATPRKAFVKRLKALQDNLGRHQDAEVHVAQLRQAVSELPEGTAPETYVAIGQLIEQLDEIRQGARDEFAERFADYDAKATRRALRAVLDGTDG
jgi:CHAD domain-containing protein